MWFAGREVRIGEKLCQRSWVRPEAIGRTPYLRPRAQFFTIRTDLGRQITCLLFSSVEYFVSSFCVEFSLRPFSNLACACVWHLENRKSNQQYTHWRKLRNDFIYYFIRPTKITKVLDCWHFFVSTSVVACVYNVFVFLKNVFLVGIIKSIFAMLAVVIWIHNCLFLRSLFTFYVLCREKKNCWKRRESWKISSGPYAGPGWENPDRWSARN